MPFIRPLKLQLLAVISLCLHLSSCSSIPEHDARLSTAASLAKIAGWEFDNIQTSTYPIRIIRPEHISNTERVTLYIEGDGLAWVSRSQPSLNPTPINPVGLKLAVLHPTNSAIYIARPCQYITIESSNCEVRDWTSARFSPKIITAINEAISALKVRHNIKSIVLVGYSGGGAIAALVAAKRDDISMLITVAGNLNHKIWTQLHRVSPLENSLNPADIADRLNQTPQWHFIGEQDDVIPAVIAESYHKSSGYSRNIQLITVKNVDHHCCWQGIWPQLWAQAQNSSLK